MGKVGSGITNMYLSVTPIHRSRNIGHAQWPDGHLHRAACYFQGNDDLCSS